MGTIGDLERRAGIGQSSAERTAFWQQFHHLAGQACLDAGVAELRRMIAAKEGWLKSLRVGAAEFRNANGFLL